MRIFLSFLVLTLAVGSIYDRYYAESLKIAKAMTLDQKIGQTIQADFYTITEKSITDPTLVNQWALGSLLVGGNAAPGADGNMANIPIIIEEQKIKQVYLAATTQNWNALTSKFTSIGPQVTTSQNKTYKIKLLLGTDAVHNNQHAVGTILFPHNIGMSCTHNAANFYNLGYWTSKNVKATGFNYAFAPTVAVSHNPQWGRYYETMGQQHTFIYDYAKQYVRGLQSVDTANSKINGVLGSVKHFFGDGSTLYGANEGDARVYSFKNYITHNTQGYYGAVASEIGNVMCSYSAINDIPMAINSYYLQSLLRQDIKFAGFVISDWDELTRIPEQQLPTSFVNMTQQQSMASILNAGVDMIMLSGNKALIERYIKHAKKNLNDQAISLDRLEDAVAKIISVKFSMGLVEQIQTSNIRIEQQSQAASEYHGTSEYADSLQAVQESLVLLKNTNSVIPVKGLGSTIQYVVLVGQKILGINRLNKFQLFRSFDNIGMQSGGWSVRWQGFEGNDFWMDDNKLSSNASSILDILRSINNLNLVYPNYTTVTNEIQIQVERTQFLADLKNIKKNMTSKNTIILGVIGESPYAESAGDVNIPYCQININDTYPGCKYDSSYNPYIPLNQPTTLDSNFGTFDQNVIDSIRQQDSNIPLITVLLSGRPMIINKALDQSTAFLAAWLPGTSGGQGIINAITGNYIIRPSGSKTRVNSLSMDWPKDMNSLKNFPIYRPDGDVPEVLNPLFPVGFGLSTGTTFQQ